MFFFGGEGGITQRKAGKKKRQCKIIYNLFPFLNFVIRVLLFVFILSFRVCFVLIFQHQEKK